MQTSCLAQRLQRPPAPRGHQPDESSALEQKTHPAFALGELFEAVGGQFDEHAQGIASKVRVQRRRLFAGLQPESCVGRHHSRHGLYTLANGSIVTPVTDDGVLMSSKHHSLPITVVQFHTELVLTPTTEIGLPLLERLFAL
jgi:anthranilate/para-aminobenzoate synthase component II